MTTNDSFATALTYARGQAASMDLERIDEAGVYIRPMDYYVLGSVYPPLKAMQEIPAEEAYKDASDDLSLYIHIPFCDQYCTFCHFAKVINPANEKVTRYMRALYAEMALVSGRLEGPKRVRTIYFGGGTASFLAPEQIRELFANIRANFDVVADAEITYELHPNLIRRPDCGERLDMMQACGVNRWVYGVQSMDDRVLEKLNRGHTGQDVLDLLAELKRRGQENISLDLIFGLPYQTLESWHATLTRLVEAEAPKFNIFPLMFKSGDPITLHYFKEPEIFPDASDRILMHYMCDRVLLDEAKYTYGPVFYYSKKSGVASQQQAAKFENIDNLNLLGLGVSAFAYVGGTHYYNICEIDKYAAALEEGRSPVWAGTTLTTDEKIRRTAMMSIRAGGITKSVFMDRFGVDPFEYFATEIGAMLALGLLERTGDTVVLTRLGALHGDGVGTKFVSQEVLDLMDRKNEELMGSGNGRRDLMERFDYSPLRRRIMEYTSDVQARVAKNRKLPLASTAEPSAE